MPRVCVDTHTHTHTVNAQWSSALRFICTEEGGHCTLGVTEGKQLERFLPQGAWALLLGAVKVALV